MIQDSQKSKYKDNKKIEIIESVINQLITKKNLILGFKLI